MFVNVSHMNCVIILGFKAEPWGKSLSFAGSKASSVAFLPGSPAAKTIVGLLHFPRLGAALPAAAALEELSLPVAAAVAVLVDPDAAAAAGALAAGAWAAGAWAPLPCALHWSCCCWQPF